MQNASAILLTFIKLPFIIKIFILSIFEWPLYTAFTVMPYSFIELENTVKGLNKVRLVGNLSDVLYGIVEVKYNGQWMDVSADNWTDKDRRFVCNRILKSG